MHRLSKHGHIVTHALMTDVSIVVAFVLPSFLLKLCVRRASILLFVCSFARSFINSLVGWFFICLCLSLFLSVYLSFVLFVFVLSFLLRYLRTE